MREPLLLLLDAMSEASLMSARIPMFYGYVAKYRCGRHPGHKAWAATEEGNPSRKGMFVMRCQEVRHLDDVLLLILNVFSSLELAILLKGANHVRICPAVHFERELPYRCVHGL